MSYIAMYRKYRPNSFSEVEGQNVVTTTLKNALKTNKFAHAYLFSGPRGTGKTSVAKIFARAVNCERASEGDVCNKCKMCKSLLEPTISDILEIDAASNNGVDEIRDLREKARYAPSIAKYKVYIIDEVHMLSQSAFNALLKILEEPPKHIIFILATTELHKIPATIISRCQCFEFKNISRKDIIKRLNQIAKKEDLVIDNEAIELITDVSAGALRDAIGLLDQIAAYTNGPITKDDVYQVSGSISDDDLTKLISAIDKRKLSDAMLIINNLLEEGKEITKLVSDLITILKDILISKSLNIESPRFNNLDKTLSQNKIFFFIKTLSDLQYDIRWTVQKKSYLEVSLMKMMDFLEREKISYDDKINKLDSKIQKVQENLEKGITVQAILESDEKEKTKEKEKTSKTPLVTTKDISKILSNAKKAYLNKFSEVFFAKQKTLGKGKTNDHIKLLTPVVKSLNSVLFTTKLLREAREVWKSKNKEKINTFINELDPKTKYIYIIAQKDWEFLDPIIKKNFNLKTRRCDLPNIDLKIYKEMDKEDSKIVQDAKKVFGNEIIIKK